MDDKEKIELEEKIIQLENIKGRHTELVTVMIPAGFNINQVTRQLEAEKSTAANIKSKATRSAVTDSLDAIIRHLKSYKQTPPNGLAIFAGNISEREGTQDIKVWAIEPPKPLNVRMYRCDQTFVVQPLKEMLQTDEVYGLLTIDRQEATIGLLEGKRIKVIRKLSSGVPGKVRAGGQCLAPDTLIETREGNKKIKDIKMGDEIKAFDIKTNKLIKTKCTNLWKKKKKNYIEIIIRNCWNVICSRDHLFFKFDVENKLIEIPADSLSKEDYVISYDNKRLLEMEIIEIKKINEEIELIDIETEAKNFFANGILVHNSSQRFHRITEGLAKEFFRRVAEEMKTAFFEMPRLKGILVGGPIPTKEEFLEEGNLATKLKEKVMAVKDIGYVDEHGLNLLVEASQEDIAEQEIIKEKKILEKFFNILGKNPEKAAYKEERVALALERGAVEILLISKKLDKEKILEFEKKAANIGAEVIMVSDETEEAEQFFNITQGLGAILRFALE